MRQRFIVLLILLGSVALVTRTDIVASGDIPSPTLVLGFLLLTAYCIAYFLEQIRLPRITGFIVGGLMMGPYVLNFFDTESIEKLGFLNTLALAFIAFSAGGELKLKNIRHQLKSILFQIIGITAVVFTGVTVAVFLISGWIPFMSAHPPIVRAAMASIFGVIAVARSPSSTIAIISETKAKGTFTETVLSVTIVTDVLIIIFFGIVISFCQVIIKVGSTLSLTFFIGLMFEIGISFTIGFFLGKVSIFMIENIRVAFPIVLTGVGFMVIKFSHLLGSYLFESHQIALNLEPLLICMAAGFTVQNFSNHGTRFLLRMNRVSFPIYIAFFALTGASINLDVLRSGWFLGILLVLTRTTMLFAGSYVSGRLSGDRPLHYQNSWLGFITQAGVSLGLLSEIVRRFPEIGVPVQTILIAAITLNQLIGPIAFKYALDKVGESQAARNR
ncbi:cation:proton antiporter [bacterium]|nr:cation:proton antiporter [bacterium]